MRHTFTEYLSYNNFINSKWKHTYRAAIECVVSQPPVYNQLNTDGLVYGQRSSVNPTLTSKSTKNDIDARTHIHMGMDARRARIPLPCNGPNDNRRMRRQRRRMEMGLAYSTYILSVRARECEIMTRGNANNHFCSDGRGVSCVKRNLIVLMACVRLADHTLTFPSVDFR